MHCCYARCSQHVTGNTSRQNQPQSAIINDNKVSCGMRFFHFKTSVFVSINVHYGSHDLIKFCNIYQSLLGISQFCEHMFCEHMRSWRHHQMGTFSSLLALCAGNSPVTVEFPAQRPVTWSFDVFFDLRLNKWISKQSRCRWFEIITLIITSL